MMGIRVGSTDYRLMPSKPNKTCLRVGGSYANLSTNRPSTTTLKATKGNTVLYLTQPSYYLGNVTHGGNHAHNLDGGAGDHNASYDDVFSFPLQDLGDLTVLVNAQLITRQYYYSCTNDCDVCSGADCAGSEGCGQDKYFFSNTPEGKLSALNRFLEFIDEEQVANTEEEFIDMPEVEIDSRVGTPRVVTAVGVACTDSWDKNSIPNGGRFNTYDGHAVEYAPFPTITDLTSSYFDDNASGSVSFRYDVAAANVGAGWVLFASWDSWYNRDSNGWLTDTCRVWVEFFVRREGAHMYVLRRINSLINQGGERGQQYRYSIKSSVAMGMKL